MNKAFDKIKQAFDENPLQVLGVAALVTTAVAKVIDATANAASRRTWAKEVNRRDRMTRR